MTLQELEELSTDWAEIWMEMAEKSSRDLTHIFGLEKWETSQNTYIRVTLEYSSAWYLFLQNTQWQELSKHVLYSDSAIKQLKNVHRGGEGDQGGPLLQMCEDKSLFANTLRILHFANYLSFTQIVLRDW